MQSNLDVCRFDPGKLETGCDGLRVRILTEVHSIRSTRGLCENYGRIGDKSTVRYEPWLENLVRGFVRIVPGEMLPCILLGEGSLEASERIRVEEVVWVVWFARWVVRHRLVRGGGWRRRGSLHSGRGRLSNRPQREAFIYGCNAAWR